MSTKSAIITMRPNYTKKNGYWDNLAVRKDERFYVQLEWREDGIGTLVFRDHQTHNIISQMPITVETMVGSNNNVIFDTRS